ncbi:uncharacterized protein C8Q71DRAFT_789836 [Rhodofomes roseus]|uniref:DUF6697 domain-containing protein n=1 Tax=Rhodofomes roseus TaxID=34475 RepID=A0ABQ8JZ20_9APHY|nr:uncharacterized protein C8Q71DRAFT_789836 [Rhodofomes roseus]KAH9829553.1 hypothetical protein C8Q71DRAFT_789836 [Rhodofomes roseus]
MPDRGRKRKLDVQHNYDEAQKGLERLSIRDNIDPNAARTSNPVLPPPSTQVRKLARLPAKRKAPAARLPRLPDYTQARTSTQAQTLSDSESEDGSGSEDAKSDDELPESGPAEDGDDLDMPSMANMSIRDFEINEFLQTDPYKIVPDPPVEFEQLFVSVSGKAVWQALTLALSSVSYSGKVLKCMSDMTIWTPYEDLSRCVVLYPAQRWNFGTSRAEPAERKTCKAWPRVRETRDMCFSAGGAWHYCGTYQCTGMSIMRLDELCKLDKSKSKTMFNSLVQQTPRVLGGAIQRSSMQTMSSIMQTLRDAYQDGHLLVRCYGFQLVGHNDQVKEAFLRCLSTVKQKKDKKRAKKEKSQSKGGRKKKKQRLS